LGAGHVAFNRKLNAAAATLLLFRSLKALINGVMAASLMSAFF